MVNFEDDLVAPVLAEVNACPNRNRKPGKREAESQVVDRARFKYEPAAQKSNRTRPQKEKRETDCQDAQAREPVILGFVRSRRFALEAGDQPINSKRSPDIAEQAEQLSVAHERLAGSTKTAVPYASTSVTPCMISVAS